MFFKAILNKKITPYIYILFLSCFSHHILGQENELILVTNDTIQNRIVSEIYHTKKHPQKKDVLDEIDRILQQIKKRAFDSGLDIMGLSTHQSFVSPDASKRKENVELTKHQIEVAYSLGIPTIRINTGRWGTTKPKGDKSEFDVLMDNKGVESVLDGFSEDEGFKWVIDSIEKCIPTAEKCGVVLGLENHWGLGLTSKGVMRIVDAINSPWLSVTLDTGNFFDNRKEQLAELAPHTCLIQAKTYFGGAKWPAFNQINIDYESIGKLMRDNNYKGYISLEFEGNEDANTAVPKSLDLLRKSFFYNLS